MILRQLWRRAQKPKLHDPQPFRLIKGQKTRPPIVVPYDLYGHGTLHTTPDRIHYARLRPFIGRSDPVLHRVVPDRQTLAHDLATGERREIERALWQNLFSHPPTHVLRLGWVSLETGNAYDTFYIYLNFFFPGFDTNGLAKESVSYMLDWVQRCDDRPLLVPTQKTVFNPITNTKRSGVHFATMFWFAQMFYHYRELTIERPAARWKS